MATGSSGGNSGSMEGHKVRLTKYGHICRGGSQKTSCSWSAFTQGAPQRKQKQQHSEKEEEGMSSWFIKVTKNADIHQRMFNISNLKTVQTSKMHKGTCTPSLQRDRY